MWKIVYVTITEERVIMKTYFSLFLCALSFSIALAVPAKKGCDTSECKGPIEFYKELGCKPVFKSSKACCPSRYNCDNLKDRRSDKCYANGHEYSQDESLRPEDANPCDRCFCSERQGVGSFACAIIDCFHGEIPSGCYQAKNATDCCATMICPENPEDVPKCVVEGKTYEAGEYFSPSSKPKMDCYCSKGFNGEFKAPWCKVRSPSPCGIELRHTPEIVRKCAPVYSDGQSTQSGCPINYRCQNAKDQVIKGKCPNSQSDVCEAKSDDMKCHFGDLTMDIGDELNQGTDYSSICVKCVCDVPPWPTCRQLPAGQCDRG